MKSILLASASVLAFAGAAAAEISWSGVAVLGYNDDADDYGDNNGFYWDLDIDVVLSQTLDNGLTAGAEFGFEVADDTGGDLGQDLVSSDFVLFVESDTAALYFGDTDMAADKHWTAAGDMESDSFSATDGETVLRGDVMVGGIDASISYIVSDTNGNPPGGDNDLAQLSVGATGTFGNFTVGFAYQEDDEGILLAPGGDFTSNEMFGVFASTTFGAADITVAYAQVSEAAVADAFADEEGSSLGIEVAYPFGPVTATFYYVMEECEPAGCNDDDNLGLNVAYEDGPIAVELDYQDDQGTTKIGLEGSYDVGNGLVVYAGYLTEDGTEDRFYVGGEMDLGGGASLLVSYADDEDFVDEDEVGAQEYQNGTTVEVSFEF